MFYIFKWKRQYEPKIGQASNVRYGDTKCEQVVIQGWPSGTASIGTSETRCKENQKIEVLEPIQQNDFHFE